jgi:hypothetical protein
LFQQCKGDDIIKKDINIEGGEFVWFIIWTGKGCCEVVVAQINVSMVDVDFSG